MAEGPVGLLFPDVDAPAGWTSISAGPRRWLLPPGGTREQAPARIVLVPLLPKKSYLTPRLHLEDILRAELKQLPNLQARAMEDTRADSGLLGVFQEVAVLADAEHVRERRAYAVFADERIFYTLFLQATPDTYDGALEPFRGVARSLRPLGAKTG